MTGGNERGGALLIVLLLVATLAFIALAISERTGAATARSANLRLRHELFWRAQGAEVLAQAAIAAAAKATPDKLLPENPLFAKPLTLAMEEGGAELSFSDATRCFNVNAVGSEEEALRAASDELRLLLLAADGPPQAAPAVAAGVADWIDSDSNPLPFGAEDGHYAGYPVPYRTAGRPIAAVSELRAVAGIDRAAYRALLRYACALPSSEHQPVNVNMLERADAPLLAGLMGGAISLAQAEQAIAARPIGGYDSADAFFANRALARAEIPQAARARVAVSSRYIKAVATLHLAGAEAKTSMLFETTGSDVRLIRKTSGPSD